MRQDEKNLQVQTNDMLYRIEPPLSHPVSSVDHEEISESLSPLMELRQNIELCAKKQKRLAFSVKEISELLKKQS